MSTKLNIQNPYKLLILIILIAYSHLFAKTSYAKKVLTKNIEAPYTLTLDQIHYSCSNVGNSKSACEGFFETSNQIHDFLKNQIYPKVPEKFLNLIKNEIIEVEFSALNRGGLFTSKTKSSPLKITLKQSALKLSITKNRFAHEWFHALQSLVSDKFPSWYLEGSAQLFSFNVCNDQICPKHSGESLRVASTQSNTSLLYPFPSGKNEVDQNEEEAYGHTFLYFLYLYQSCGGDKIFWEMLNYKGNETFESFLDKVLIKSDDKKWCGSFLNSVKNAEIARLFNHFSMTEDGKIDNHTLLIKEGMMKNMPPQLNQNFMTLDSFLRIEKFRPLLFSSSHMDVINKLNFQNNFLIYSFKKTFPYTITEGLSKNADSIFIMKIRD